MRIPQIFVMGPDLVGTCQEAGFEVLSEQRQADENDEAYFERVIRAVESVDYILVDLSQANEGHGFVIGYCVGRGKTVAGFLPLNAPPPHALVRESLFTMHGLDSLAKGLAALRDSPLHDARTAR
jgi:nucleoside 2-deoxyribosyltransferase